MRKATAAILALALASACGDDDGGTGDGGDGGDQPGDDATPGQADAATGGDDGGTTASCEHYCETIMAACLQDLKQYIDLATCLATCPLFPPGAEGDDTGDSLACRVQHAEWAAEEPGPHCYHAGPSGGRGDGVCGGPCDGYCDIMLAACPGEYVDDADCMEICAGFPDPRPYSILEARTDTVACRIWHATRSTVNDGHCKTAAADSGTCTE